jgi:hypothetical protein
MRSGARPRCSNKPERCWGPAAGCAPPQALATRPARQYGLVYVIPAERLVALITTTDYRVAGAGALTDRLLTEYVVQALGASPR